MPRKSEKIQIEINKKRFSSFLAGAIFVFLILGIVKVSHRKGEEPSRICDESKAIAEAKESVVKILGDYGSGSGFVISKDGFVLTNYHVAQGEEQLYVVFEDGQSFLANFHNGDPQIDVAVLKINSEIEFKPLLWGSIDDLKPGETVYAIGYPLSDILGGESSVTKGSFSAKRQSEDGLVEFIQTDASLNSGNSGGPLLNRCGKVVGINEVAISESDGLNFAISEKTAENFAYSLMKASPQSVKVAYSQAGPALGPGETVALFYSLISLRQIPEAFNVLSPDYQTTTSIEEWIEGYKTTLNVYVNEIRDEDPSYPSVYVNLTAADLIGDQVRFRDFEGVWYLVEEDNKWKLDHGPIYEIK